MAQTTANSSAFVEAEQYSNFILMNLHDGLLPETLYRNVTDFPAGTNLNIKVVGSATLQDVEEDKAISYQPIDSGTVVLNITDYVGDAWYVTDKLKQDGAQIEQLMAARAMESTRAIQENFETKFLRVAGITGQTASNRNDINGFAHRWVAGSGTTVGVITLEDFLYMKLAFDKALMPEQGRVAIVDPIVEAALNYLVGAQAFTNNPQFQGLVETGFGRSHRFIRNIFGWDIYVSNRLATVTETINGGPHASSKAVTAGKANVFMCVADDMTKPFMGAWRQMPKVDGEFNKDLQQDEYVTTARWGFGLQRPQALGVLLTSASAYK